MISPASCPHSACPRGERTSRDPAAFTNLGLPRLVDESVLRAALEALDAVINCEPFADVSPPGTEGFDVYEVVAMARELVAEALGKADSV